MLFHIGVSIRTSLTFPPHVVYIGLLVSTYSSIPVSPPNLLGHPEIPPHHHILDVRCRSDVVDNYVVSSVYDHHSRIHGHTPFSYGLSVVLSYGYSEYPSDPIHRSRYVQGFIEHLCPNLDNSLRLSTPSVERTRTRRSRSDRCCRSSPSSPLYLNKLLKRVNLSS